MPGIVWKGSISFGLVSLPVQLHSAARAEAIHFHMLHRTDQSRVKEVWYCAQENKPIERAEVVKGYEMAKGRYVLIGDDEPQKAPVVNLMEALKRSLKASAEAKTSHSKQPPAKKRRAV
ncbi:MAG: Ku protein [Acidobacteriota bacterium]